MFVPYPSQSPSPVVEPEADAAKALGGAAVGLVGVGAIVMGVVHARRVAPSQQQPRQDRDKEPSESEQRARAPSTAEEDTVDISLPPPTQERAHALFAVKAEDVEIVQRILTDHGAYHKIIRGHE
jgi:hypothetical protein